MITKKMVKIFKKYDGNMDISFTKSEEEILSTSDRYVIIRFIEDILMIKNGVAAESYTNDINKRLIETCDSEETIDELKLLADETLENSKKSKNEKKKGFGRKLFGLLVKSR